MTMRTRILSAILVLAVAQFCLAAPPKGVKLEQNIAYVPNGDPSQVLDLYLPEKPSDKPLPLIIWIHGGGWRGGSKAGTGYLGFLMTDGYAYASIEYRFSQKALFPAQIQDCLAAIRWLRANAKKYNLDADHFAVGGDSAGGHLVALIGGVGGKKIFPPIGGNEDQSDRVQGVCDWYGPIDFTDVMAQAAANQDVKSAIKWQTPEDPYSDLIGVKLGEDKTKEQAVSPIQYVSKDYPPILIMHGDHDQLVPFAQSQEMAAALQKLGVDVTLQKFPGANHGGPAFSLPAARKLEQAFLDKHLKGMETKVQVLPDDAVTPPAK
jgi:acetyl esterase/lipase